MGFNSRSPSGLRLGAALIIGPIIWGFNSRSPSGLRRGRQQWRHLQLDVSIHAAQAGCDKSSAASSRSTTTFQFTQPKRAATRKSLFCLSEIGGFNSRSPSGLRHSPTTERSGTSSFNSRSPSGLRRLLQRYNKKEILSKDKSRKSLLVIILDVEDKAIELELTDNQPLRNSNKIMFA